jgi:hypothetical protein
VDLRELHPRSSRHGSFAAGGRRSVAVVVEKILGVMTTPDGYWRVEVYRQSGSRTQWFRLLHGTTLVQDHAVIATLQRVLGDAYADLQPVEGDNVA